MFLIINKEKLNSYIISIATVIILFIMAGTINPKDNTIQTGANLQSEIKNTKIDIKEYNENNYNSIDEETENR